jgi:putative PEP-CTERM system TPR-repeat lipoprotein
MSHSGNAVRCATHRKLAVALLTCVPFTVPFIAGCGASDPQTLIAKANAHIDRNEYRAAVIELKNVLAANPDHAEARYRLGIAYDQASEPALAVAELKRALDLGYDADRVLPRLGAALLATGQYQKVLDELKTANSANPQVKAEMWVLQGQAHIELGEVKEGRALMEQAFASQPDVPRVLLARARLAATDRRPDSAAPYIERAIANAPKDTDAWVMKGDLLQASRDNPGASAAYAKAVELNSHNVAARLGAAMTAIERGAFEDARKHVDYVRKNHSGNLMGVYAQALLEFRQGNLPAARDAVAQILKAAPDHLPTLVLGGAIDTAMGTYAQAQARLERVLDAEPGYLTARKMLVTVLAQSGQMQRARDIVAAGLKQAPKDAGLLRLAGELDMRSGDFANAAAYFEKAATSEPGNPIVRTRLGMSRLALGETDRGLSDLGAAAEMDTQGYQADAAIIASHLRAGRYDDALEAVRKLEEKQPKNPFTYNLKAAAYTGKNDIPSARKALEHALTLQPTYVPAAVNLARFDLKENNKPAARKRLESVLAVDRDNVQALMALAELGPDIGAGREERIQWLEHASRSERGSVQARMALAQLYMAGGEMDNALNAVEQAQAVKPDSPELLGMLGRLQVARGQKQQAVDTYARLVALQPGSPVALHWLASAQALSGNTEAARSTLNKALRLQPDFVPAYSSLAELDMRAGRPDEAMKYASQLQKQFPKLSGGWVLEGDILMAQSKYPRAAAAYEKARTLDKSGAITGKLHTAYERGGRRDAAESLLTQWLKESPEDSYARMYVAETQLKHGMLQDAQNQYEWLREKHPNHAQVLNNLAWIYQQLKDPRALETAERAYSLQPGNPASADTLGCILVEKGDTARALPLLQKAAAAAPGVPAIRYHLAQAWVSAGDKAKARSELERILKSEVKFAEQPEAARLLAQLQQ